MSVRPSCLCLSLLAILGGSVAPASAENVVHSGTVGLTLSPGSISGIPLDVTALAGQVCDEEQGRRPMAQCHVIVKNGHTRIDAAEGLASAGDLRFTGAEPLSTPCGLWDTSLTLDPALPQPASPLALEERPDDPGSGLFAVVLEMNTNLRLVHRETGRTADFPLRLGLGLAGPWVVEPTSTGSRLHLLADRRGEMVITFESCIPVWVFDDPNYVVIPKEGCEICLVAAGIDPR